MWCTPPCALALHLLQLSVAMVLGMSTFDIVQMVHQDYTSHQLLQSG